VEVSEEVELRVVGVSVELLVVIFSYLKVGEVFGLIIGWTLGLCGLIFVDVLGFDGW